MKRSIVLLALFSLIIVGALTLRAQHRNESANQGVVKIFQYPDFLQKPPVEIIAIKVNGEEIQPGRPFLAADDWVKNFSITVRNVSQHNIKFVEAEIEFPRDAEGNPILTNVGLFAGQRFHKDPALYTAGIEDLTLKPSETVEFSVFPTVFTSLQKQLKEKNVSQDTVNSATLRILKVTFDNDKGWAIGYPTRRDVINPNKWRLDKGETDDSPPQKNGGRKATEQVDEQTVNAVEVTTCYRFDTNEDVNCAENCTATVFKLKVMSIGFNRKSRNWKCYGPGGFECANHSAYDENTSITCGLGGGGGGGNCDGGFAPQAGDITTDKISTPGLHPISPDVTCVDCECQSPVILDVNGNGFNLTDAPGGVKFDLNKDGMREQISWTAVNSDDAWLALDRDGDGAITNGGELFGNYTPQPSSPRTNGFLALAEFDKSENGGNGDHLINAQAAIFTSLRLWQDRNHNGVSEASELKTLGQLHVVSLSLDYSYSFRTDEHGNRFRYKAPAIFTDGRVEMGRWAWDVFLTTVR